MLAGVWGVVALLVGAVLIAVAVDLNDSPRCVEELVSECYLGSETEKLVGIIGLGVGGALLIVGGILSLAFAIRGRAGRAAVLASISGAVIAAIGMAIG